MKCLESTVLTLSLGAMLSKCTEIEMSDKNFRTRLGQTLM